MNTWGSTVTSINPNKKDKDMTDNDTQFLEFITGTLLPDMEQDGPSGTADDIKRLVRIIRLLSTDLRDAKQANKSLARMVDFGS